MDSTDPIVVVVQGLGQCNMWEKSVKIKEFWGKKFHGFPKNIKQHNCFLSLMIMFLEHQLGMKRLF